MRSWHLLLALAWLPLSGCTGIATPRACTLIGCYSGLEVVLDTPPTTAYRIEAELPGQPGRLVVDCTSPGTCNGRAFFADFTPDVVRIHVVTASGTTTHVVQPRYTESRPNGPDCPPVCRTGRVNLPATPRAA